MFQRNSKIFLLVSLLLISAACQRTAFEKDTVAPASLRDVPALKMNFRFETDVPAPPEPNQQNPMEEKSNAVQADFDQTRPQEILEKTISSPDKQGVLAVYRKAGDQSSEFRLDMYAADGRLLRKITPNGMAVHFPDTIVWSPDGSNVAFVAVTRLNQTAAPNGTDANANVNTNTTANIETNINTDANTNAAPVAAPTQAAEPSSNVLTFRTEQIYIANADGGDLKLLTQNEGLIYFYFIWSPDGSALAALAATWKEWQFMQYQTDMRGEIFVPMGRPRLVEKNGRERRLDDNLTVVQPVWSPDSAKVAIAYDKEIRIYDAISDAPTQAAIPLRNPLLISSKTFDEELRRKTEAEANSNIDANANSNANVNVNSNVNAGNNNANVTQNSPAASPDVNALPDESTLVSFNPIVQLEWTEDKMLYLQTGYIKEMKDTANSARSYLRWHRLLFSPQAVKIN